MVDKDGGNGVITHAPSLTGFTQYVEKREFKEFCDTVETALWGADKRDGIVADVNSLKMYLKIGLGVITFIVTFVSPIITTLLLRYMGG